MVQAHESLAAFALKQALICFRLGTVRTTDGLSGPCFRLDHDFVLLSLSTLDTIVRIRSATLLALLHHI